MSDDLSQKPPKSAAATAADAEEERWRRTKANVRTIGGAVLLAFFIRIVLFEAFEIDGPSMEPTLLNGDRVVVAKFLYGLSLPFMNEAVASWGMPSPGDVVIVQSPADEVAIVKRVIGVPGDRIEIREDVVYRNGEALPLRESEDCIEGETSEELLDCEVVPEHISERDWRTSRSPDRHLRMFEHMEAQVVPEGHVFVLGDHRDHSNDSRNPRVGMIPIGRVKGRALSLYWSRDAGQVRWNRIFTNVR
jgi:signal peptidase I